MMSLHQTRRQIFTAAMNTNLILSFFIRFYNPKKCLTPDAETQRSQSKKHFEGKKTDTLVILLSVSASLRQLLG
jgi:hypothetical protein